MFICTGCDRPVWEAHKTIEEHLACESAQQQAILRQIQEEERKRPKRDNRMTARNAGRKARKS